VRAGVLAQSGRQYAADNGTGLCARLEAGVMIEIETNQASLDTMAVTIQALHVSKKQMTLAVFRQLPKLEKPEKNVPKIEGIQNWGVVRYSIKDEGEIWIVFSHNGKLFRRELRTFPPPRYEECDDFLKSLERDLSKISVYGFCKEKERREQERQNLLIEIEKEKEDWPKRKAKQDAFYQSEKELLNNLPQLFIAV